MAQFLMIGNTYLKLKLLKWKFPITLRHYNALYHSKGTKKIKDFKNSLIKKFISSYNLQGKRILTQENFEFDRYIFAAWYTVIHFSLLLNHAIHRMGKAPKIPCPSM